MRKLLAAFSAGLALVFLTAALFQTVPVIPPHRDAGLTLHYKFAEAKTLEGIIGPEVTFTRSSNKTCWDSGGVLQTLADNIACFDHDPSSSNKPLGLLIEEARTNEVLQSEDLSTTWTLPGANTTLTTNAGVAPDRNTTADDVEHDDNAESVRQTLTATDNTVYTLSAFVKRGTKGTHDWVLLSWEDASAGTNGFQAWFDLSTGNVGTAQATGTGSYTASSATMKDGGSGWFLISAAGQIVSGQTDVQIDLINTTDDAVETAQDGEFSVFWWGLDAQIGAFHTSYIATTTAAIARSADVATVADLGWYNESQGTFYVSGVHPFDNGSTVQGYITMDDGSTVDRVFLQDNSSRTLRFIVSTASSDQANLVLDNSLTGGDSFKAAFSYATDDFAGVVDGGSVLTDTSGDPPTGLTEFKIGDVAGGTVRAMNSTIAEIKYWRVRKPNGFLIGQTAANDNERWYAANDNFELRMAVGQ